MNSGNEDKQRRSADRFPMDREVRFRVLERKSSEPFQLGKTINMSSNGVLFSTDQFLNPGRYLEIAINWPAQLDSKVALKLMARGRWSARIRIARPCKSIITNFGRRRLRQHRRPSSAANPGRSRLSRRLWAMLIQ